MIKSDKLPELQITDSIYKRVLYQRKADGKNFVKLIRVDGFKTKWLGRDVGLSLHNGIWVVTDLKTGIKMPVPQYKKRGYLLNYMANRKNNQNLRMSLNNAKDWMKKREDEFKNLKQLYDYNKNKGVEKK